MKKIITLAALMAVSLGVSGSLWAKCSSCRHGHGADKDMKKMHEKKIERLTKKLDLTEDQQSHIKTIFDEKHEKMTDLHQQMEAVQKETEEKIDSVLTAEQKERHDKLKQEKMKKWKGKNGKKGKKGKGPGPCCGDE